MIYRVDRVDRVLPPITWSDLQHLPAPGATKLTRNREIHVNGDNKITRIQSRAETGYIYSGGNVLVCNTPSLRKQTTKMHGR